jgi:hypothetical protein
MLNCCAKSWESFKSLESLRKEERGIKEGRWKRKR